jgi:plastocyanin
MLPRSGFGMQWRTTPGLLLLILVALSLRAHILGRLAAATEPDDGRTILVTADGFVPAVLDVSAGTTVTWRNETDARRISSWGDPMVSWGIRFPTRVARAGFTTTTRDTPTEHVGGAHWLALPRIGPDIEGCGRSFLSVITYVWSPRAFQSPFLTRLVGSFGK